MQSVPASSSWNATFGLNLAQLTTSNSALSRCRCRPRRLPCVHLEVRATASPGSGAPALRPGHAAAPRGPGCPVAGITTRPVLRVSQPVWMGSPGRRRALSRRWRSSAHRSWNGAIAGQRVPLRQRMRAALKLLFGPAKTAGG
jgi:hypothetical protein